MHLPSPRKNAFTLVELLVVVGILMLLVALLLPVIGKTEKKALESQSVNNLRQLGQAVTLYAADHDMSYPCRVQTGDKWPILLADYLQNNIKIYAEPDSPSSFIKTGRDPLNNVKNYTSYVLNGFNDQGALDNESLAVRTVTVQEPSRTILLTAQDFHPDNFYMDYALNELGMVNTTRYRDGSYYLFADGSVRFLAQSDYDPHLWLVDKTAIMQ